MNETAAGGHEKCTSRVGRHVLSHAEGPRTGARTDNIVVLVQRHGRRVRDIIAKGGIVASVDREEEAVGGVQVGVLLERRQRCHGSLQCRGLFLFIGTAPAFFDVFSGSMRQRKRDVSTARIAARGAGCPVQIVKAWAA